MLASTSAELEEFKVSEELLSVPAGAASWPSVRTGFSAVTPSPAPYSTRNTVKSSHQTIKNGKHE
jgi:hypothetical protein